jgi:uncharacterized cupin superfamily protein
MGPYGVDEFMLLLEGKLVMGLPDGSEITLRQGDAFVIPKGLECQWRQPGYLRKYFMILDAPVPGGAENPALPRITVPDLAADLPAVGPGAAVESSRTDFVNAAGTLSVGVRHCAAASIPALPVRESMLVHVLAGRLTLTGGAEDGASAEFAAGETAYLRRGGVVGWRTDAGTRLLQSRYASP